MSTRPPAQRPNPSRPDPGITPRTITLNGRTVTYRVRRSPRATRITLRVHPDTGVEVVVPQRGRLPALTDLLRERAGWILGALDRVAAHANSATAAPLADGSRLPYQGDDYRLIIQPVPGARPAVARDATARTLTVRHDPAKHEFIAVLEGWYRAEARAVIAARVGACAAVLGVGYARLTIRDTRSRWGSCSSAGGLNFSWRLILAPPAILEYVVVHELAHRRELNHSARFWAIVAAHCPTFQEDRAWLRAHGGALFAFLNMPA
jgi:predicted metal-dependent hydrolase